MKMALTKVFSKTVLGQAVSRKVVLSGASNGSLSPCLAASRALSSALAESYYNQEQKELQATTKKLIETEINPVRYYMTVAFWFPVVLIPNLSYYHIPHFVSMVTNGRRRRSTRRMRS